MDLLPKLDNAPRVVLVVDNPLRDLPGYCLLALELVGRGCKVFLVPMYLNEEVFSLAPDFVLLNYLRKVSRRFAEKLIRHHIPMGVLDTEGGPIRDLKTTYVSYLCDDPAINREVVAACCWGAEVADVLRRAGTYREENLFITGNPRFDLYREPWRKAVRGFADEVSKDIVLFCSNFGLTNSQYGDRAAVRDGLIKLYDYEPAEVERMLTEEDLAIAQFTDLVGKVAREFPQRQFIYRPHPFEAVDFYEKHFGHLPNVAIVKRGAVVEWLLEARAIIQLNCTTCYDAWFAGTPSLKPGWIQHDAAFGSELAINHSCPDLESLLTALHTIDAGTFAVDTESNDRAENLVHRFFGKPDAKAHLRVADVIMSRLDLSQRPKRLQALRSLRSSTVRRASRLSALLAWPVVKLVRLARFQPAWNPWSYRALRAIVRKHDASEKRFDTVQVKKIVTALAVCKGAPAPRVVEASKSGEFAFGNFCTRTIAILPASVTFHH